MSSNRASQAATTATSPTRTSIPQAYTDIVSRLLLPPDEAYYYGRLTRSWMRREFPNIFRQRDLHLKITSNFYLLGYARLGLPRWYWNFLTGVTNELRWHLREGNTREVVGCDASYWPAHWGHVVFCVDCAAQGHRFAICESCVDSEEGVLREESQDAHSWGTLVPMCRKCDGDAGAHSGASYNGCLCDKEPRCFRHRREHLQAICFSGDIFRQLLTSSKRGDPGVLHCVCGAEASLESRSFMCGSCEHIVVLPPPGEPWAQECPQLYLRRIVRRRNEAHEQKLEE